MTPAKAAYKKSRLTFVALFLSFLTHEKKQENQFRSVVLRDLHFAREQADGSNHRWQSARNLRLQFESHLHRVIIVDHCRSTVDVVFCSCLGFPVPNLAYLPAQRSLS